MFYGNSGLVLLVSSLLIAQQLSSVRSDDASSELPSWQIYKSQYGKNYLNSGLENSKKQTYLNNLQKIAQFNAESHGFKLGVNQFTDETLEEFKQKHTGLKPDTAEKILLAAPESSVKSVQVSSVGSYPTSKTYQNSGYVSSVKNQGQCGSCWAFSSAAAIESQTYKVLGRMISPSQQQLVDCSNTGSFANSGCYGGNEYKAYNYMSKGIMNETLYPYTASNVSSCKADSSKYVVATIPLVFNNGYMIGECVDRACTLGNYYSFVEAIDDGTGDLKSSFANAVIQLLNDQGPLAIHVCAGNAAFNAYGSGIYSNSPCTNSLIDHAVLLVGYDISSSDDSQKYWIVKNQWGSSWGLGGYMRMQFGAGLIRDAHYPIIDTSFDSSSTSTTTKSTTTTKLVTNKASNGGQTNSSSRLVESPLGLWIIEFYAIMRMLIRF